MRRVPDVTMAHAKGARAGDDDICQAAQQGHHVSVRIREAADLAAAGVGLALAEGDDAVEAGDEVTDDRRPVALEVDRQVALEPPGELRWQLAAARVYLRNRTPRRGPQQLNW